MITDYMKNKVKKDLGFGEEMSQKQVCISINRKRSEIRADIDIVRQEISELGVDPITILSMPDYEYNEYHYEIELKRDKYKLLHKKLVNLNLSEKILSCETKGR